MRPFLAGFCGLALLMLTPAHHALAQSQNQTPAASQKKQATPPAEEEPAASDDAAPADDATGTDDAASGDDQKQAPIVFEGGTFTIEEPEQYGEKVLAYDGQELARNYDVSLDRLVEVNGVKVALFGVGDGGNACGPAELIVWKKDGAIRKTMVGEDDCGAPPAAVAPYAIYFVPYLMPGGSGVAMQWSPEEGLMNAGEITYLPEPGTSWKDLDPSKYQNIIDAFHNEAVYRAAQKLLGKDLTDVATSLLVGGGTETTKSGAFYASGCVPHDCGGNDGFMAVDPKAKKLYFAQRSGDRAWPPLKIWPAEIRAALDKSFQ